MSINLAEIETHLAECEEEGCKGDTLLHQLVCHLVSKVRNLQHQLADPNYQYAGGRIHRQAIVCRNEQQVQLYNEIKELKAHIETLKAQILTHEADADALVLENSKLKTQGKTL